MKKLRGKKIGLTSVDSKKVDDVINEGRFWQLDNEQINARNKRRKKSHLVEFWNLRFNWRG